jgi:hypothetical protein
LLYCSRNCKQKFVLEVIFTKYYNTKKKTKDRKKEEKSSKIYSFLYVYFKV